MSSGKANKGITRQKSSAPQLADGGIEPIPLLGKQFEVDLCFGLGSSSIDQFQVSGHLLAMFVGDIFERIAHQVDHAQLHARLGIEGLNRFWEPCESIHASNEEVFDASML